MSKRLLSQDEPDDFYYVRSQHIGSTTGSHAVTFIAAPSIDSDVAASYMQPRSATFTGSLTDINPALFPRAEAAAGFAHLNQDLED